ncbi:MAG TPA: hypothetical protein DIW23_07415 [Anaerolineae bacterium]|nr:hypothetical protein [Anaerolineae bacterium]HCR71253.1 hypothetical protein [Anaerolineae bacterium]
MNKQIFLLKITLGTIFAMEMGAELFAISGNPYQLQRPWASGFLFTFFHFLCIVIMQWLLLSDYLPKRWITLGFVGCIIASIVSGIIYQVFSFEAWFSYNFEIKIFARIISGALFALPQLFVLQGRKGYLWILANSIAWTIQYIGWELIMSYTSYYDLFLFIRILVVESPNVALGLFLGIYLYIYVYNHNK